MLPSYRPGVTWCDLHDCLPSFLTGAMEEALPLLERKLRGYAQPDALLTAVETRSSSPVRILRDESGQSALRGLYPCGEGAGYAGRHPVRRSGRYALRRKNLGGIFMMRKLAVVADYLNDSHRAHIEKMAGDAGFTVDYFTEGHLPQDRAGEYEVIYGTVPPKELKAATALRWFCCAYAGMDQWKDDALYHSSEVMLSNSSGAYGVTISEHMVMVTLMLLRQMPTVQEWMHRHDWSDEKPPMRSVCGSRITVLGTGDIGTSFARRVKAMGAKTVVGVSRSGRHVDDALRRHVHHDAAGSGAAGDGDPGHGPARHGGDGGHPLPQPHRPAAQGGGGGERGPWHRHRSGRPDGGPERRTAGRCGAGCGAPEPLPPEHPLWNTKNLLLTPHLSGFMSLGITRDTAVALFCEDFENYIAGRPLKRLVDRRQGLLITGYRSI